MRSDINPGMVLSPRAGRWRSCSPALAALALFCCISLSIPAAADETARPRQTVTPERYAIKVSFQPEHGFLHARASVTLRASPALTAIEFGLNPHLKILEVTDAQGCKLEFARSGRLGSPKLSVRLARPDQPDSGGAPCPPPTIASYAVEAVPLTLTFVYEGVLPVKPLDYITKDGILLRDESRWYPAVDLSAFTQNDITIEVPVTGRTPRQSVGWVAISSGELLDSTETHGTLAFRWKTTRPVSSRSIVAFPPNTRNCKVLMASDAGEQKGPWSSIRMCVKETHQKPLGFFFYEIASLLNRYSAALGPYPSAPFTVIEGFPGQRGAIGHSAPGFLVVSADVVKYYGHPGYAPEFLAHEVAHQWFPIEVTLAREEDGWLAESLAEYLAWRSLEEKDPAQARRIVARAMRDALAAEPLRPLGLGLRLFARENDDVARATLYQRGLLVWRTLETVIDRARVDRALREYFNRYQGKSASIADFRKICEEISGRDLGWFFDYFIAGTEIPEIQIRRAPAAAPNEAAGEILVKNVPPDFSVRVEMRLETAGSPVDHSVATRGETTPFTITSPQPAARLVLDPDQRILRWTEAARRNRSQRALLANLGPLERQGQFSRAGQLAEQALALDPGDLAANEQTIRFALARLRYRQGHPGPALAELDKVLTLDSLDSMESDFNHAWARVYRARIEKRRRRLAAARAEAQAGLAMKSPALDARVVWPEAASHERSAAEALRAIGK